MIVLGPPPGLARLRLHWHVARTNFERRTDVVREYMTGVSESAQTWTRQVQSRFIAAVSLRARAAARQTVRLTKFEAAYDEMVDVVCWAAKEESNPRQDERFARCRVAMRMAYRPLRREMRSYWLCAEEPEAADPFEALFLPDDIDIVINAATGIESMMRTRAALEAYRAELNSRCPQRKQN